MDHRENNTAADPAKLFTIDKAAFGTFLAELRRSAGFTQRELAEKLFVSDKAVSKWERGLSLPDISLLIPLSNILQVSVTELLEGRRRLQANEQDERVEALVKKALTFSEEAPVKKRDRLKKYGPFFAGITLVSAAETAAAIWLLYRTGRMALVSGILVMEILSLVFGIYFWFFMKERLNAWYDENRITTYSDGAFSLSLPGSAGFNNRNWPYIIRQLRRWSVLSLLASPLQCIPTAFLPGFPAPSSLRCAFLLSICARSSCRSALRPKNMNKHCHAFCPSGKSMAILLNHNYIS